MSDKVIREFLISIGVKADGAEETSKKIDDLTEDAKKLGLVFTAAAAAVAAAVVRIASEFDTLYWQSKRIGSSATEIKAFTYAVSQMGGTAQGAQTSLENVAEFVKSTPGAGGWLSALGLNPKVIGDTKQTIDGLSRSLSAMPYWQAKRYAAVAGIDPLTLQALRSGELKQYEDWYASMSKQVGAMFGVDMDDALGKSHEFMTNLRGMKAEFGLMFDLASFRVLEWALPKLEAFAAWVKDMTSGKALGGVSQEIRNVIIDIGRLLAALGDLAESDFSQRFAARLLWALDNVLRALTSFARAADLLVHGHYAEAWQEATKDTDRPWNDVGNPSTDYSDRFKSRMGAPSREELDAINAAPLALPKSVAGTAQQVIDFFKRQGAGDVQARGIAAMLYAENTTFDPHRLNGEGSGAIGLAQWLSKDRLAEFKKVFGHDLQHSTFAEQLQFVKHELTHKYRGVWEVMKRASNPLDVAKIGIHGYESPGSFGELSDERNARRFLGNPFKAPPLGAGGARGVTLNQQTTIQINGGDARQTGTEVAAHQDAVNERAVNNAGRFAY